MVKSVFGKEFKPYGRILRDYDMQELLDKMKATPVPDDVIYVPSDETLEALAINDVMIKSVYGNMPVQIGYCNGHNNMLNALEYHRSSEINVAVNDLILLLGRQQDIADDFSYDTANVEAFLVPAGTAIEVYATTLHYAPCGVDGSGFQCVVVLPRGTNYDLKPEDRTAVSAEDKLLAAVNKWLIAHPEAHIDGAFEGLKGENISV